MHSTRLITTPCLKEITIVYKIIRNMSETEIGRFLTTCVLLSFAVPQPQILPLRLTGVIMVTNCSFTITAKRCNGCRGAGIQKCEYEVSHFMLFSNSSISTMAGCDTDVRYMIEKCVLSMHTVFSHYSTITRSKFVLKSLCT